MARNNEFPVQVFRVGTRCRVATQAILGLLGHGRAQNRHGLTVTARPPAYRRVAQGRPLAPCAGVMIIERRASQGIARSSSRLVATFTYTATSLVWTGTVPKGRSVT